MDVALIGLGRMGLNMTRRLLVGGHSVVAFDLNETAVAEAEAAGAAPSRDLDDAISQLAPTRVVWIMVPAGPATEQTVRDVGSKLQPGDVVIDGGNSNFQDSMRRAASLAEIGVRFVDAGTSGGVWGLTEGYSLMVGGEPEAIEVARPLFETLAPAPERGWGHVGPAGAGHFVKMVHNGIEYGLMQAYAEGFELMKAKSDFGLDLHQVAEIWRHGSVVRSWLLDLTANALQENPELDDIAAWVSDSGEGRWTVQESIELAVPTPVITAALQARFRSRQEAPFGAKLLAAMRNQFGGHAVKKAP